MDLLLRILVNGQHKLTQRNVNCSSILWIPKSFLLYLLTWTPDAVLSFESSASAMSRSLVQPQPAFKAYPKKMPLMLVKLVFVILGNCITKYLRCSTSPNIGGSWYPVFSTFKIPSAWSSREYITTSQVCSKVSLENMEEVCWGFHQHCWMIQSLLLLVPP